MDQTGLFEEAPTVVEGSVQSIRSELSLFELPPTDISSLYSSDWTQCYPMVSLKEGYNPLEFLITTETSGYFDPSDSYLMVTARIVRQDGTLCDSTDVVTGSNLFFHTMFNNVEMYVNGSLVFDSGNFYPHIAYLNRLLSTSPEQKLNQMRDEFFYPNTVADVFRITDAGFNSRYEQTKNSQQFVMCGQLQANLLTQPRYLPAGTTIRLVIRRSLPEFCLESETTSKDGYNGCPYKVDITEAIYFASRKIVSPQVLE